MAFAASRSASLIRQVIKLKNWRIRENHKSLIFRFVENLRFHAKVFFMETAFTHYSLLSHSRRKGSGGLLQSGCKKNMLLLRDFFVPSDAVFRFLAHLCNVGRRDSTMCAIPKEAVIDDVLFD